jgi:hypothetical protein
MILRRRFDFLACRNGLPNAAAISSASRVLGAWSAYR